MSKFKIWIQKVRNSSIKYNFLAVQGSHVETNLMEMFNLRVFYKIRDSLLIFYSVKKKKWDACADPTVFLKRFCLLIFRERKREGEGE